MIKCQYENGNKVSLRHVTVDGIIFNKGKILLNLRGKFNNKPILESGKWGLIGGFIDRDETVSEAFKREAYEEAGCVIDNIRLLRIKDTPNRPKEDRQNISFVLIADLISIDKSVVTEEVRELKWFDLDKIPNRSQIAFDHGDDISLFREYINNKGNIETINRFSAKIL